MPVVTIRISEGRTLEQRRLLADEITRTSGVDSGVVTIFEEPGTENIARGEDSSRSRSRRTFFAGRSLNPRE